jgi:secreted Zn-dependent insulinase-like peptidase
MASRLTTLAFEYNASFDYYPKLISSVENLTYDDVKGFVHETLSRKNTRRLAVLVEGKMTGKRPFIYRKIGKEELGAIGELEPRQYR